MPLKPFRGLFFLTFRPEPLLWDTLRSNNGEMALGQLSLYLMSKEYAMFHLVPQCFAVCSLV